MNCGMSTLLCILIERGALFSVNILNYGLGVVGLALK